MAFLGEGYGDSSPPTPGVPPNGDFCVLPATRVDRFLGINHSEYLHSAQEPDPHPL